MKTLLLSLLVCIPMQDSTLREQVAQAMLAEAKAEKQLAADAAQLALIEAKAEKQRDVVEVSEDRLAELSATRAALLTEYLASLQPATPDPDPGDLNGLSMDALKKRARRHRPEGEWPLLESPPLLGLGDVGASGATYSPTWFWALNAPVSGSLGSAVRNVTLSDLALGPKPQSEYTMKWFARLYQTGELVVDKVDCVGTLTFDGSSLESWPKEHTIYASVSGSSTITNTYVEDIGGQAFQIVNRAYPYQQYAGDNAKKSELTTHTISNVGIVDVGHDATRGAFAISYFDPGTPTYPATIRITNVDVALQWDRWRQQNDWTWYETRAEVPNQQKARRAEGVMVIHNFQAQQVVADEGIAGPTVDKLIIEDSVFARGFSGQPFMNFDGVRVIEFRRCHFRQPPGSAPANIDPHEHLRELLGHVEEVTFEDCTGRNVIFRVHTGEGIELLDPALGDSYRRSE